MAVQNAVGKAKFDTQTWAAFFYAFSAADWSTVRVDKKRVKDLLADGAYQFNDSNHSIPAEEVMRSIACMRQGSLRNAWEEIFFLAFGKLVSDVVFAEEAKYAAQQQQELRE